MGNVCEWIEVNTCQISNVVLNAVEPHLDLILEIDGKIIKFALTTIREATKMLIRTTSSLLGVDPDGLLKLLGLTNEPNEVTETQKVSVVLAYIVSIGFPLVRYSGGYPSTWSACHLFLSQLHRMQTYT